MKKNVPLFFTFLLLSCFSMMASGVQKKHIVNKNAIEISQSKAGRVKSAVTGDSLTTAIADANNQLNNLTKAGINPGQFTVENRAVLQQAVEAATTVKNNPDATAKDKYNASLSLNAAITTYLATKNTVIVSTTGNDRWYWIKASRGSTADAVYAENQGVSKQVLNKVKTTADAQLWKVVANGTGYAIVNKSGSVYLNTAITSGTNMGTVATMPTVPVTLKKSTYSTDATSNIDYYLIENTGTTVTMRVHAGGSSNNFGLMNWTGSASDNCSFQFLTYDPNDVLSPAIMTAETVYSKSPAGTNPGNYSAASRTAFRSAIDAAIALNNSVSATKEQKTAQVAILNQAKQDFIATRNPVKLSTGDQSVWYYIVSANPSYSNGQVMVNQNTVAGSTILFTTKSVDPNKLWRFVDAGNGKVAIQNRASGLYISAAPATATASSPYTVTFLGEDAQFTFNADGKSPLHAQQSGSVVVTWAGGLNSASAWKLEELPAADNNMQVTITEGAIKQGLTETGIGNTNLPLSYLSLSANGLEGTVAIKSFTYDLTGTTDPTAIKNIRLYALGNDNKLKTDKHTVIAQADVPASATAPMVFTMANPYSLALGNTNFCVVADVADNAKEGTLLDNRLLSVQYSYKNGRDTTFVPATKTTPFATTVFLKQSVVLAPGDYNSVSYRIPAITTAADGSLVTLTDKRKYNSGDLPGDIDILARRSTDGGKTWSAPVTVALGTGGGKGFGDAVIVKAKSGKLIAVYVGGTGLWSSTADNPIRTYVSTSSDNGLTWTAPTDITSQLFGSACSDPVRKLWKASFCGSGHGLCTRSGRIMVVGAVSVPNEGGLHNYAYYSDDEGITWKVSNRAITGGDEAKVVELNNGNILMSSRTGGNRLWAVSTDGGINWGTKNSWTQIWGNACDADIVRYTSTLDGYNKNRLLHTLPNANDRSNLSMWISYDEGATWPKKKTLCPGTSAYSSITILPDGTIGVYYELDGSDPYTMNFINLSLNWLTSGSDTYLAPTGAGVDNTHINPISASVKDGRIVVHGTTATPKVYTVSGAEVDTNKRLLSGVYVVRVDDFSTKVIVD